MIRFFRSRWTRWPEVAISHPTRAQPRVWPHLLAGALVTLYIGVFSWLALMRHASFNSAGFDLGVYDQVVWNTLHGRIFFYTSTGQPLLHLSNHADPILLLLAPFYLIYSGPQTLLVLQAAAIGLGGLPIFWLARHKLESDLAGLSLLYAYLLFPALQVVTLSDFHPPALAVGFLSFAFYFLVKRKAWPVLLLAVLAMACKEQIPLVVVMLGLYGIVILRAWRLGLALVAMGVAWFLVVMYWVIPAFSVTGGHIFLEYFTDLGATPLEIVKNTLTHPALVVANLWQPDKLAYLRDVLIPFAGLPLLGLPALLIGLPTFGINLLSANPAMHDATRGHYGADVAPWLAWGALFGVTYLVQGLRRLWPGSRRAATAIISLLLLGVALAWQVDYGYSPLTLDAPRWEISDHDRLAQRFLDQIPADAPIAAQGELYPHLSDRMIAYNLPAVGDADYVLVDVAGTGYTIHPSDLKALVLRLLDSGEFGIQDAADGYLLLRRGTPREGRAGLAPEGALPDAFYDFARVDTARPPPYEDRGLSHYPVRVDFGDKLRLLGFDVIDDPRRQETSVRLYWQALRPVEGKLRLYPFFLDGQGGLVEDTNQRPLVTQLWYPPRAWQPGEIVTATTLPWTLGETWSLAVGVLDGSDWSDRGARLQVEAIEAPPSSALAPRRLEGSTWVRLATFERRGRYLALTTPSGSDGQPEHPLRALRVALGGQMALLGYDVSPPVAQRGRDVTVTLHWQAAEPTALDYTVFVHVLAPDGRRVAQHDAQPWWDVPLPTSSWLPGETLRDRHTLSLSADLPAGAYRLQVGVYYWQTGERLPVVVGGAPAGDAVELGTITVE